MEENYVKLLKRNLKIGEAQAVFNLIESSLHQPDIKVRTEIEGPFESVEGIIRYGAIYNEDLQELFISISTTELKERVDISIFPSLKKVLGDPSEINVIILHDEDIPQITFKYEDLLVVN